MQNLQEVFNSLYQKKKERKELNKLMRDTLTNSAEYQKNNEELTTMREKQKEVKTSIMIDLQKEVEKLEELKADIASDQMMLIDIAMSNYVNGKSIEIEDEYDSPVKFYDKLDDRRYIIDAMMEVDSINEELGLALPTGDYETMSGLLNNLLERIPHKLEKLAIGPYFVMVLDATSQRAKSVELIDLSEKTETGKPESGHL